MMTPEPIGTGPDEHAVTHRAAKRHQCHLCPVVIEPGEIYVRAVTFPNHDILTGAVRQWKICHGCATEHGRPLPPAYDRGLKIDPEAVDIALRGKRVVKLNRRERRRVVYLLTEQGLGAARIGARIGVTERTVQRIRAGLRDRVDAS